MCLCQADRALVGGVKGPGLKKLTFQREKRKRRRHFFDPIPLPIPSAGFPSNHQGSGAVVGRSFRIYFYCIRSQRQITETPRVSKFLEASPRGPLRGYVAVGRSTCYTEHGRITEAARCRGWSERRQMAVCVWGGAVLCGSDGLRSRLSLCRHACMFFLPSCF